MRLAGLNALRPRGARWLVADAGRAGAAAMLRVAGAIRARADRWRRRPSNARRPEREGQVVVRVAARPRRAGGSVGRGTPQVHSPERWRTAIGRRRATRAALEQLRGSAGTLGPAATARSSELDLLTLQHALEQGTDAVKQLLAQRCGY
jgi:hypothetical protein